MDAFPLLNRLPPYVFRVMETLKKEYQHASPSPSHRDVIDLGMGNPDLPTPEHIVDELIDASRDAANHRYGPSTGLAPLRRAVCNWYARRFGTALDPETESVVTIGAKEGLVHLALATTGSGDVVLVPNPSYPVHADAFTIAGAQVRRVPLFNPAGFLKELKFSLAAARGTVKMIVVNFPANPTTTCVDLDFFEELVAVARKYDAWVVHDLAYGDIVFDGYRAPSILEVRGAKDVAVEFFSLSKSYSMPGWRVGFMCGNRQLVAALSKMKSHIDYGLFQPIQAAAVRALEGPQDCVATLRDVYRQRREVLCDGLRTLGWEVNKPQGTMFVWAPLPYAYRDMGSMAFAKKLLWETGVVVSPGNGFGSGGEGFVRFSLVADELSLRRAVHSIGGMLKHSSPDACELRYPSYAQ